MKYDVARNDIEVCKHNNFVYIRNYKCASTFFYWNFVKKFNWQEISYHDIDWQQNHVFSHMLDPIERRHKGIAEKISMHGLSELFLNNDSFQQCFEYVCLLDKHTETYCDKFQDRVRQIDWIPLNRDHNEVIERTEKCLGQQPKWNMSWVHYGDHSKISHDPRDSLKKQVELKLQEYWDRQCPPEWAQIYYRNDIKLYNDVVAGFNSQASTWNEITWLKR